MDLISLLVLCATLVVAFVFKLNSGLVAIAASLILALATGTPEKFLISSFNNSLFLMLLGVKILTEELLHHHKSLLGGDHLGLGVGSQEIVNTGGVVRLHVLHDQIIGLAAFQGCFQIGQPLAAEVPVHGVHDGDLFV